MNHVYAVTEVIGSSPSGLEDAINNAIATAARTLRHLDWFEVTEIRGHLKADGAIDYYQVGLKLGFRYEPK